jgi:hypothetical protein
MFFTIRLSPSGPPLTNDDGGMANPGPGFQLRAEDALDSSGVLALTGTFQQIPTTTGLIEVSLANPDPALRYSAELICVVQNTGAAVATWQIASSWRVDAGAFVDSTHVFGYQQVSATNESMCCKYTSPLTAGGLLSAPVLGASTLLTARFVARTTIGAAAMAGNTLFARIIETL